MSAKQYSVIYADPPWSYSNKKTRSAAAKEYPCMTSDELKELPVASLAADDCTLFLWATSPGSNSSPGTRYRDGPGAGTNSCHEHPRIRAASNHVVACPLCSSLGHPERPAWWMARRTSERRGHNCYFWTGCEHARGIASPDKIREDPEEWAIIEGEWADWVERAFAERTLLYPPASTQWLWHTIQGTLEASQFPAIFPPLTADQRK